MIEIDELIAIYRQRFFNSPSNELPRFLDITQATITYLVAFKQVHEMLKNLGNAIQGVNPEGD